MDLINLAEQTLAQNRIWASCGSVDIQVFENRLTGRGIQFTLWYNGWPLIRAMQRNPRSLTIAVAPQKSSSIDNTTSITFLVSAPLVELTHSFPYPHVCHIVNELLAN